MPGKGKPFQKGNQAGKGHGRPMLNEELQKKCREFLGAEGFAILEKHAKGNSKGERMKALEIILDRGYGKAIQPTKELQANESYADFLRTIMSEDKSKEKNK